MPMRSWDILGYVEYFVSRSIWVERHAIGNSIFKKKDAWCVIGFMHHLIHPPLFYTLY
jgi:hypothetical protein